MNSFYDDGYEDGALDAYEKAAKIADKYFETAKKVSSKDKFLSAASMGTSNGIAQAIRELKEG